MKIKLLFLASLLVLFISGCTDISTSTVEVNEGLITLNPGETHALDVDVYGDAGTYVSFQSKDPNIVAVSEDGVITAVGSGETLVTVRAGVGTDYVMVRVLGNTAAAFDTSDFLTAYESGAYQIELKDDITLNEVLEIDRPIEILFNGYTLTGDLRVVADFEGGIALNNEQPLDNLIDMTDAEARVLNGTLDMGGFLIPIYVNFVTLYDFDNPILQNYYEVDGFNYSYLYSYENIGDAIPIASLDDLNHITQYSSHIFAEGTPYERVVLNPSDHENYVLVNDIQGESTLINQYIVLESDDGTVYVFNDTDSEPVDIFTDNNDPELLVKYTNTTMYSDIGFIEDVPAYINDYLTANSITMTYAYDLYEYEFEMAEDVSIDLYNFSLDGREYTIRNFEFDTNDELFDYAEGTVEVRNLTFESLYGKADDTNDEGIIFGEIDANQVTFYNLYLLNMFFVIESDDNQNYGMLVGNLEKALDFSMVRVVAIDNIMVSDSAGDSGILFGEMDDVQGNIINVNLEYNLNVLDSSDNDSGIFAGYIQESELLVYDYNSSGNKVISDNDEVASFAGDMEETNIRMTDIYISDDKIVGDTEVGTLIGNISYSNLTLNRVYTYYLDTSGDYDIGVLIGEVEYSTVDFSYAGLYNSKVSGTYNAGLIFGSIRNGSKVNMNMIDLSYSTINDFEYNTGGFVGSISESIVSMTNNNLNVVTISNELDNDTQDSVGGFVGYADNSVIHIEHNWISDINITGESAIGGYIGTLFSSTLSSTSNEVTITDIEGKYSIGGYIGVATLSVVDFKLEDINVKISGDEFVAGVIGYVDQSSIEIDKIYVSVEINSPNGLENSGGLLGYVSASDINASNTEVVVDAMDVMINFGGVIGYVLDSQVQVYYIDLDFGSSSNSSNESYLQGTIGMFIGSTELSNVDISFYSLEFDVIDTSANPIDLLADGYSLFIGKLLGGTAIVQFEL